MVKGQYGIQQKSMIFLPDQTTNTYGIHIIGVKEVLYPFHLLDVNDIDGIVNGPSPFFGHPKIIHEILGTRFSVAHHKVCLWVQALYQKVIDPGL